MRKLIISAVLGGIIIFASLYFAGLIADSKENKRPPSQKIVKTVFVDTVQNTTVPIMVPETTCKSLSNPCPKDKEKPVQR